MILFYALLLRTNSFRSQKRTGLSCESITSTSDTMIAERMRQLVQLGVKFSLDDYGTGYANLTCLVHFPFSAVKLDKSLLWDSFSNEKN